MANAKKPDNEKCKRRNVSLSDKDVGTIFNLASEKDCLSVAIREICQKLKEKKKVVK